MADTIGTGVRWVNGLISRESRRPVFTGHKLIGRRAVTAGYLPVPLKAVCAAEDIGIYAACYDENRQFLKWIGNRQNLYGTIHFVAQAPAGTAYIAVTALYRDSRPIDTPDSFAQLVEITPRGAGECAPLTGIPGESLCHDSYLKEIRSTAPGYPATVSETCRLLGAPLPADAHLPEPPSAWIDLSRLADKGNPGRVIACLKSNGVRLDEEKFAASYLYFRRYLRRRPEPAFTETDFIVWYTDWALFSAPRGFAKEHYMMFRLYEKAPEERDTFLNSGYRRSLQDRCNNRKKIWRFNKKTAFLNRFSTFISREWLDTSSCTFEEFAAFLSRHDSFFAKPLRSFGGQGAGIIRADSDSPESLFARLRESGMLLEELIRQHPDTASFNPDTVNTARVYSLVCADGTSRILMATMRMGRTGRAVDNFHGGGIGVLLDPETGTVISDGIDGSDIRYPAHPDSGIPFRGFVFPCWEKVRAAVLEAALVVPDVRSVGWDITVTASGTVEFVEGNTQPGFSLPQATDLIGKRHLYEPHVKEILALSKIRFPQGEPWYRP